MRQFAVICLVLLMLGLAACNLPQQDTPQAGGVDTIRTSAARTLDAIQYDHHGNSPGNAGNRCRTHHPAGLTDHPDADVSPAPLPWGLRQPRAPRCHATRPLLCAISRFQMEPWFFRDSLHKDLGTEKLGNLSLEFELSVGVCQ